MEQAFAIDNAVFLPKALHWACSHAHAVYLADCQIPYPQGAFRNVLAVGAKRVLKASNFEHLQQFHQNTWLFGYLSYDLQHVWGVASTHEAWQGEIPLLQFFEPLHLLYFSDGSVHIISEKPEAIFDAITAFKPSERAQKPLIPQPSVSKAQYMADVEAVRQHIVEGDVYELNYCFEWRAADVDICPVRTFLDLCARSPMPFASFLKMEEHYALCASPERFLKKDGQKLLTQPIKGTIRRGTDATEDELLRNQLRNSEKELAENMMIVDLVRNDLARVCKVGSVKADELFGIYTFRQLHQMISSVSGRLKQDGDWAKALHYAFPMGSMTGAPKIKAMELIERYERSRRGLFSGSIGCLAPHADFDFNVVIRTIFYNEATRRLSFQVGSAITYDAVAEREYEECLLKVRAILEVLAGPVSSHTDRKQ